MRKSPVFLWRWVLALFFVLAGANHFLNPGTYISMVPAYLPSAAALVWISGLAEVVGGFGLLFYATRRFAGWGLIALLIAVFPANLHVALNGWPGMEIPGWALWLRLPFQLLLIWWVYWVIASSSDRRIASS